MSLIQTGSFSKDLWPGVEAWYGMKYNSYDKQYERIFDVKPSDRAFEEIVGSTGFGLAKQRNEGADVEYEGTSMAYIDRYNHAEYALGFIITKRMYMDGLAFTESLRRAEALAFSINQTIETIAANILNRAFNSSYTYGDGKELCATDHPNFSGGIWRNELTTAADLSESALEQACIDISKLEDDKGKIIKVTPQMLIIPADLVFEAKRVLGSNLQSNTANNDTNALKDLGYFPKGVTVNNYLTDTDAWFIRNDIPNGMTCFEREKPSFGMTNDFDTDNMKCKTTVRLSFGCSDKRDIFGTPGAA